MRNEERLLEFLHKRWNDLGQPELLPLSANEISKEWNIIKNQRTVVTVPVEVKTTRTYVSRLLKRLEANGKLSYDTTKQTNPSIRIVRPHSEEGSPIWAPHTDGLASKDTL